MTTTAPAARRLPASLLLAAALVAPACGDSDEAPMDAETSVGVVTAGGSGSAGASTGAGTSGGADGTPADPGSSLHDAMAHAADADLDEDTVTDYLALIAEMRATGDGMASKLGGDPSQLASAGAAMGANSAWIEALDDHGFDQASFMQAHTAITMAFGALIAEEQMEQHKASMPPGQYELMKQTMSGATSPFGKVSDEHRQLVQDMLPEVKAAFGYEGP